MKIGELNDNLSHQLRVISAGGEPVVVDYYGTPRVTITPPSMFDELVEAAGKNGQEILDRYRVEAEQRKQETAA